MMTHYHSKQEFCCHWEIPYDPNTDFSLIAKNMIDSINDNEVSSEDDSFDFFQQDFEVFKIAVRELKAGRNANEWLPIFHGFIEKYQRPFEIKDAIKSLELLQAVKSKRLLKQLDMNDDLDIKVHMEIVKFRNEIYNKYNLALPCT